MRIYLYPIWLRLWHWLNAILFLLLIISGVSLHYSASGSLLMPFKVAIGVHNFAGIVLSIAYLTFVIGNFVTGNWRQYLPAINGLFSRLIKQARYYISGIFKHEPHPYDVTKEQKFNPLQQISYLKIMYVLVPFIVLSGLLLMFPEIAPEEVLGLGGLWPMATAHAAAGFFLSIFTFGHIYLATTGDKVTANFKSMVTGWHNHTEHESNEPLLDESTS